MKRIVFSKDSQEVVNKIISFIKKKKVIVCPTDTVYGLICDINSKEAVRSLFEIKKRSRNKPLPVFVKDINMAKEIAYINKKQERFLKKVWPGKITIVLKSKKKFPKGIASKENKIGLRIPDYNILNILLEKLEVPLSATSANISGKPSSIDVKEIIKQFEKEEVKPDLIVDSGRLRKSKPSTVIDLTGLKIKILRKGEIKKEELKM